MDIADAIKEYKKLLDDGVITQEEFDAKRSELMSKLDAEVAAPENPVQAAPADIIPEAAEVTPEPIEVKPEPVEVKPEPIEVTPDPNEILSKPEGAVYQTSDATYHSSSGSSYQQSGSFNQAYEPPRKEKKSPAWGILGFFIPIVGLILFIVWKNSNPIAAKYAGIGALIGFGLTIVTRVIGTLTASGATIF